MPESAKSKGMRLWLPASDIELILMVNDPSMNREQLEHRLENLTKEELLFLIKKFTLTHQKFSNAAIPLAAQVPLPMSAPISADPEPEVEEAIAPDLEDLESLDFD